MPHPQLHGPPANPQTHQAHFCPSLSPSLLPHQGSVSCSCHILEALSFIYRPLPATLVASFWGYFPLPSGDWLVNTNGRSCHHNLLCHPSFRVPGLSLPVPQRASGPDLGRSSQASPGPKTHLCGIPRSHPQPQPLFSLCKAGLRTPTS
jgi:hypothetical protein